MFFVKIKTTQEGFHRGNEKKELIINRRPE